MIRNYESINDLFLLRTMRRMTQGRQSKTLRRRRKLRKRSSKSKIFRGLTFLNTQKPKIVNSGTMISRWQLGCFVSSPWPALWSSWRWDITIINTVDRLDIVLIAFSSPYKTFDKHQYCWPCGIHIVDIRFCADCIAISLDPIHVFPNWETAMPSDIALILLTNTSIICLVRFPNPLT